MDRIGFYSELDDLLQLPQGTIRGDQVLKKVRRWDSFAVVSVLVLAESNYGVALKPDQIAACETVQDLALYIEDHLKSPSNLT